MTKFGQKIRHLSKAAIGEVMTAEYLGPYPGDALWIKLQQSAEPLHESDPHFLPHACADKPALREKYIEYYNNYTFDIMCMPTTPATAPPIYSVEPYMLFRGQYLSNRVSASLMTRIVMMHGASLACRSE